MQVSQPDRSPLRFRPDERSLDFGSPSQPDEQADREHRAGGYEGHRLDDSDDTEEATPDIGVATV